MVASARNRKTIEVAPAVYAEIQQLVRAGYWLSFQEFAREALKDKLDKWASEHSYGHPAPQGASETFSRSSRSPNRATERRAPG